MDDSSPPKLYSHLAEWWPLVSAPFEYAEEAAVYRALLQEHGARAGATLLELGCGGGNNASHLKRDFEMTLTDISPQMLDISRALNPECDHVHGDMRSLRLGRAFDAVFVHDAIDYMTSEDDLQAALFTIAEHCRPDGAIVIAADDIVESFQPTTEHGGNDGEGKGIRYLQWSHSPSPDAPTYLVDFAYLIREGKEMRAEHDRHVCGLFSRATWLRLAEKAGLDLRHSAHTFSDGFEAQHFVGTKAVER